MIGDGDTGVGNAVAGSLSRVLLFHDQIAVTIELIR